MTRKGPLITLLGGVALAGALLAASMHAAGRDGEPEAALAGGASPTASPAPSPPAETPTPAPDGDPTTYVGYVDQGGASVAIIIDGDQATAYVCDGVRVEAWLHGRAHNGELLLDGDDGQLVGSYDDQQAAGRTIAQGQEWTFAVDLVSPPEGLYQFADTVVGGAEVDGGWIVLPDGTQVGLLTVDGDTGAAPPVDPDTGEVEIAGQSVTAERLG